MPHLNHVIIIPGLGNGITQHIWATYGWKKFGIIPHVFDVRWKVEENGFREKFARALKLVDSLSKTKSLISVVGNSAGGSFALNLFGERRKMINRVVINCGRVRNGDWPWFTFNQATKQSPSFKESVLRAQELEKTFTKEDRSKILTLRPLFDEVVPPSTVSIYGAKNVVVPSLEHSLSITLNMTLLHKQIIDFILR
jgi:pimeloyl-ACP methyl ester carboxylesterase